MSATPLRDFIEDFDSRVPYDNIHPMSQQIIHEAICDMRAATHDDLSRIAKVLDNINKRIARELHWTADARRDRKEADRLRKLAYKFSNIRHDARTLAIIEDRKMIRVMKRIKSDELRRILTSSVIISRSMGASTNDEDDIRRRYY